MKDAVTATSPVIIIGVDPGSRHTGYCAIEYHPHDGIYRYIESGTFSPPESMELSDRLRYIYEEYTKFLKKTKGLNREIFAAHERYYAARMFGGDTIGKVCGVLQLAVARCDIPDFVEVNKKTANKLVVGKGGSKKNPVTKQMVLKAVKRRLGIEKDLSKDEGDAICIGLSAIITLNLNRTQLLTESLKTQRAKLEEVKNETK